MHDHLNLTSFAAQLLPKGPDQLFAWTYRLLADFQEREMHPIMFRGQHFAPIDPRLAFCSQMTWQAQSADNLGFTLHHKFDINSPSQLELISRITERAASLLNTEEVIDGNRYSCCLKGKPISVRRQLATLKPLRYYPVLSFHATRTDYRPDLSLL